MATARRISFTLALTVVCLVFGRVGFSQLQPNGKPCDGDCSGQLPACQKTWEPFASAVFLGRAIEIRNQDVPLILNGEKTRTEKMVVTFAVEETFIGVSEKVVTLTSGGDLCGFPFSKGHEYLVYARRLPSGELYVSTCYGTNFAEHAGEDLQYLRSLSTLPHGATVYGTAFRYTAPERLDTKTRPVAPESGHKVSVRGPTQAYEAIVDGQGSFTLAGLPPGHYTVSLDTKGEISTYPPVRSTSVDIADKGCARFNFYVDLFTESSGQTCTFDFERGETPNCIRQAATGELFIAPPVLSQLVFDSFGLAPVRSQKDDDWMYVRRSGIVVVQGVQTLDNGPDTFHDGLVRVIQDGKYGFADRTGQMVVLPLYDGAMNFENGKAEVCQGCKSECVSACECHVCTGGQWFQIDTKGTVISRIRPEN